MRLSTAARDIFHDALRTVDLRLTMQRKCNLIGAQLQIAGGTYDLTLPSSFLLIAMGKAALPMTETLLDILDPGLSPAQQLQGVVIGTSLPASPDQRLLYRLGDHPLPTESSAEAALLILKLLSTASQDTLIFFLLSGGASAMVELPLHPSISLPDLFAFHRILVDSGLSIAEMNTLRKHVSAVKGGRLAAAAPAATDCTLLVSDVLPSQPEVIGSGPSLPDPTTLADCRNLLATKLAQSPVPTSITHLLHAPATAETPKPGDPAFARSSSHLLLSSDDLAQAARRAAEARGFRAVVDQTPDEWPSERAAEYLLSRLSDLATAHPDQPLCLISTGEISVPITIPNPGTGGRNQHFALHCAQMLAQLPHPIAVLSAGSDGADGNSAAAGAVVDHSTLARAAAMGFSPAQALASFNAYPLLQAIGATIVTGPTANNLRDLRLLLLEPTQSLRPPA